jgi:ketoreductase RED1
MNDTREPVAVIGAGTIGLSWAALYAARGHPVRVVDPRGDLGKAIHDSLPNFLSQVAPLNDHNSQVAPVSVSSTVAEAVDGVVAVQESGPEQAEFKQSVFALIEESAPSNALLLSSSSGIVASVQSKEMREPRRLVIGHPFNPPHILPLVEVSADVTTDQALIDRVLSFYRGLGKVPVQLHKEVPGFVANRLQIALLLEALRLIEDGVVSPRELDTIMENSLGIRWASIGPVLAFHLGGGTGGLRNILNHIGIGLAAAVGQTLTSESIDVSSGLTESDYPSATLSAYAGERDRRQSEIIKDHARHPWPTASISPEA